MSDELTVESCMKELREMFPKSGWITCRSMARFYDSKQDIGRYAEIELDEDKFIADTLSGCMAQVRAYREKARD